MLTAKPGLPIANVRRRWLWLWAGYASLWFLPSFGALAVFTEVSERMLIALVMSAPVALLLSGAGVVAVLFGLRRAEKEAKRNLASGRWATVVPISSELHDTAAAERQKVDRLTMVIHLGATALVVFGYLPLLVLIDGNDYIDDSTFESQAAIARHVAMGLCYVTLTVAMAVRRHRVGLTSTSLTLIGATLPWLVWPVLMGAFILIIEILRQIAGSMVYGSSLSHDMIEASCFGAPPMLAMAFAGTLVGTGFVWLIRWIRDPRYRPAAMKEFDQ